MEVELKDQIFQLEKLSVSFPVLEQVMNLFHKSGSSAPDIAARVSEDPILTARILKLANSEKYGSSGRIFTLNQAFVLAGFPALKNLLMGILLDQLSRAGSREEEQNPDWILHSTLVAAGARFLARKAGYPVPGEAFVAGLLHDLGIQILIQAFPGKYLEIRSTVREQGISYLTAEQKILGTDHAQLGGWLAESWNLPERLIRAILLHHLPDNIRPHESLTILVHLSDAICSYMAE
ncbi:MAG: HDOD domain-containing protein, partial [Calditrichaeota bacterium]